MVTVDEVAASGSTTPTCSPSQPEVMAERRPSAESPVAPTAWTLDVRHPARRRSSSIVAVDRSGRTARRCSNRCRPDTRPGGDTVPDSGSRPECSSTRSGGSASRSPSARRPSTTGRRSACWTSRRSARVGGRWVAADRARRVALRSISRQTSACRGLEALVELNGAAHRCATPAAVRTARGLDVDINIIDVGSLDVGNAVADAFVAFGDCLAEAGGRTEPEQDRRDVVDPGVVVPSRPGVRDRHGGGRGPAVRSCSRSRTARSTTTSSPIWSNAQRRFVARGILLHPGPRRRRPRRCSRWDSEQAMRGMGSAGSARRDTSWARVNAFSNAPRTTQASRVSMDPSVRSSSARPQVVDQLRAVADRPTVGRSGLQITVWRLDDPSRRDAVRSETAADAAHAAEACGRAVGRRVAVESSDGDGRDDDRAQSGTASAPSRAPDRRGSRDGSLTGHRRRTCGGRLGVERPTSVSEVVPPRISPSARLRFSVGTPDGGRTSSSSPTDERDPVVTSHVSTRARVSPRDSLFARGEGRMSRVGRQPDGMRFSTRFELTSSRRGRGSCAEGVDRVVRRRRLVLRARDRRATGRAHHRCRLAR